MFAALTVTGLALHDPTVTLIDRFDGTPTWLAQNVSHPSGWAPGQALTLGPGQSGDLVYDISAPPESEVIAEIVCASVAGLSAQATLAWTEGGATRRETWPLSPGLNTLSLSEHIPSTGLVRLGLEASMPLGAPPQSVFGEVRVTTRTPRTMRWGAMVFLAALASLIWVGVPTLLIAEWRQSSGDHLRAGLILAALAATGALSLLPTRTTEAGGREPLLLAPKTFDDTRAVSNAALLVANGGDTSQMYFRSPLRPAFVAHALPLTLLFRQEMIRAQFGSGIYSDTFFREFDRAGPTFGSFRQLELSLVAWLELMVCVLVWALIWRRLGCGPGAAWLAALIAAVFVVRVLQNPLTITWNLLINGVAILAVLRLLDRPMITRAAAAGAMLGLAALTKTTVVTTIVPLAAIWVWRGVGIGSEARRTFWTWTITALAVSAALVHAWFQGFTDGLVTELARFRAEWPRVLEMHPEMPRTTWPTVGAALWALAGVGWIAVVLGLSPLKARSPTWCVSSRAWAFGAMWAVAGCLAFAMPFLYPRFLKYMAPGLGLLAACGILTVAQLISRTSAQTQRDQP